MEATDVGGHLAQIDVWIYSRGSHFRCSRMLLGGAYVLILQVRKNKCYLKDIQKSGTSGC